jgi:hypothetical protein
MKTRRMLLFSLCLLAWSSAWTEQGHDNSDHTGDPPPTAKRYPGSSSRSSRRESHPGVNQRHLLGIFPAPPILGERHIWQELQGYGVGVATHRDGPVFSERLAGEIRAQIGNGRRISRIIVTGFADGIPNSGLNYDLTTLPIRCQAGISVPVDDGELALLRGCIILDQISHALGPQYSGGISWKGDEKDEPDGGEQGDKYRKAKVDIYMR